MVAPWEVRWGCEEWQESEAFAENARTAAYALYADIVQNGRCLGLYPNTYVCLDHNGNTVEAEEEL